MITLSGGNYGGYVVNDGEAVSSDGETTISIPVNDTGTEYIVEGWIYNSDGIFIGMENG